MSDAPFGLLVVDKPAGCTSHDVVDRTRRAVGLRRVGHTGTLDPAATGVLVLMLGGATRLSEYLKADDKRYAGTVRFGAATTTYDAEGEVTAEGEVSFDRGALETALARFRGAIEQRPPAWSAVRRDGERAHVRARRGESVVLPARTVTIHSIELDDWSPPDARIRLHCSSGTYVRSLAHDLGEALDCPAHLSSLRRTACGALTLDDAVPLDEFERRAAEGDWRAWMKPVADGLADLPRAVLEDGAARAICHGIAVEAPDDLAAAETPVRAESEDGRLLAIVTLDGEARVLRPSKVFVKAEELER